DAHQHGDRDGVPLELLEQITDQYQRLAVFRHRVISRLQPRSVCLPFLRNRAAQMASRILTTSPSRTVGASPTTRVSPPDSPSRISVRPSRDGPAVTLTRLTRFSSP